MKTRVASAIAALLLATTAPATAAPPDIPASPAPAEPARAEPAPAKPAPGNAVGDVVSAPFQDLNLVKQDIPPVLAALGGQPYTLPADGSCTGLATEVAALDAALGPDADATEIAGRKGQSTAAKALTQASHSLVPYRSWIRKLSGAEKRAERLAAALLTGTARRAFLKGLGAAQGCEPPAAPIPAPAPVPVAEPGAVPRAPGESPERANPPGA